MEPQLRVSRGIDVQAAMRLTTRGRVRLGLLQNHIATEFSGMNPRQ